MVTVVNVYIHTLTVCIGIIDNHIVNTCLSATTCVAKCGRLFKSLCTHVYPHLNYIFMHRNIYVDKGFGDQSHCGGLTIIPVHYTYRNQILV